MEHLKKFTPFVFLIVLVNLTPLKSQVYETARTGSWTATSTWVNGTIPPANTNDITIIINENHTVTFNDNGNNYVYGQNVTLDVSGVLQINGWNGFRIGNNSEFLIYGIVRNNQSVTIGQNSIFNIWNTLVMGSEFQVGNNTMFKVYENAVLNNTGSFIAGNDIIFTIDGRLNNTGWGFVTGNNVVMTITESGYLNSTSTFVTGDNFDLIIEGQLINTGHRFETGDNTSIQIKDDAILETKSSMTFGDELSLHLSGDLINSGSTFNVGNNADIIILENGTMSSSSTMNYGNNLMMLIEGDLYIAGYNFFIGPDSSIFLLGDMTIANHYVFKASTTTYFYTCNGGDLPNNLPNSITVENDCSVLPIELLYFNALSTGNSVLINWATASETNSDIFILEKSRDGQNWESVTQLTAAGNSNVRIEYSFTDKNPEPGIWYYRLMQMDFDGSFEYFAPVAVPIASNQTVDNLRVKKLGEQIQITGNFEIGAQLIITNVMGQIIMNQIISNETSQIIFPHCHTNNIIVVQYDQPSTKTNHSSKHFVF